MGIRCQQRPDPGRSALRKGHIEQVQGMTTMGLRSVLACAFIVSTSLLTGMAAMSSGAAASQPASAAVESAAVAAPGLLDRVKLKACQVSLAATRSDRVSSRDRSRPCSG